MGKYQWHEKGIQADAATPYVRLNFTGITLSRVLMDRHFDKGENVYAAIAYNAKEHELAIKPTHPTDRKHGMKIQRKAGSRKGGGYIHCPTFISTHKIFDPACKGRGIKFEVIIWDGAESCIVVKGVKSYGSAVKT